MNSIEAKYRDRLATIPPPGGNGCHLDLLGIANLGVIAGLDADTIHRDIRVNIPAGKRRVSDKEITDAVRKAIKDHTGEAPAVFIRKEKPSFDGKLVMERLIKRGVGVDEAGLWESSPVRLDWPPEDDTVRFLSALFLPDDLVFIGNQYDKGTPGDTIRHSQEWIDLIQSGVTPPGPFICINPLSGKEGMTKAGNPSFKCDSTVNAFRYCLVEFDNKTKEEQVHFWSTVNLPVKALIDTGGKSIHAWLDVSRLAAVNNLDQWAVNIKHRLYDLILRHFGVDGACSNPSRLSRLPGFIRPETKKYQSLMWLSHEGKGR
jgi:hypothetical protein